jgi:hypothetical protein
LSSIPIRRDSGSHEAILAAAVVSLWIDTFSAKITRPKRDLVHSNEPLIALFRLRVIEQKRILQATIMSAEQEYFRIGDRVRLSQLGKDRMPRNKSTTAKVVGFGRSDTRIRIVFDGSRYPVSIHTSYLERDG